MSLSPTAAVTDLLWLSARLKGLLDLAPKLEELGGLENYESELRVSIKTLEKDKEDLVGLILVNQAELHNLQASADASVAKAKQEAVDILSAAKEAASKAREDARKELSVELSDLAAQKAKKQKELADLSAAYDEKQKEVVELQTTFDSMTAAIAELKSRF